MKKYKYICKVCITSLGVDPCVLKIKYYPDYSKNIKPVNCPFSGRKPEWKLKKEDK